MSKLEPASRGDEGRIHRTHNWTLYTCSLCSRTYLYKIVSKRDFLFNANCLICQAEYCTGRSVAMWHPTDVMGLGVCVVEWLDLGKETAAV